MRWWTIFVIVIFLSSSILAKEIKKKSDTKKKQTKVEKVEKVGSKKVTPSKGVTKRKASTKTKQQTATVVTRRGKVTELFHKVDYKPQTEIRATESLQVATEGEEGSDTEKQKSEKKGKLGDFFKKLKPKPPETPPEEVEVQGDYHYYYVYHYHYYPYYYPYYLPPPPYYGYQPRRAGKLELQNRLNLAFGYQHTFGYDSSIPTIALRVLWFMLPRGGLSFTYRGYTETVAPDVTQRLSEVGFHLIYQFLPHYELIGKLGARGYYLEGKSSWGFDLGLFLRVPLIKRLYFYGEPHVVFIGGDILTDLEAGLSLPLNELVIMSIGYRSQQIADASLNSIPARIEIIIK